MLGEQARPEMCELLGSDMVRYISVAAKAPCFPWRHISFHEGLPLSGEKQPERLMHWLGEQGALETAGRAPRWPVCLAGDQDGVDGHLCYA